MIDQRITINTPDNWVVIKTPDCYKVLAGWSGGYLTPDSWKINSGIVSVSEDGDFYYFQGHTGTVYKCGKNCYGLRPNILEIYSKIQEHVELLEEETNWLEIC